jgi:hypothetical protein
MEEEILRRAMAWTERFMLYSSPTYKIEYAKNITRIIMETQELRKNIDQQN